MSVPAPWPINRCGTSWRYGTSWRTVTVWFDWSDEQSLWEAIETIDPLKVTARLRPIVIVVWEADGWLPVHGFVGILRNGRANCIVVDPRCDLD
jgi:hypothetical protein